MIHEFEMYSNFSKSMEKIHDLHWESGNEAQSKAGYLVKKSIERSLKRRKTHYTIKTKNGKRLIVKEASTHSMGERFDRNTGVKLSATMGNFIQWRTYSTTGTTVIGGLMKPGSTEVRRGGKVVSKTHVYGVRQQAIDILEKMDSGKIGKAEWVHPKGKESMNAFRGTHEKHPAHFIAEGQQSGINAAKFRIPRWTIEALANRENLVHESMEKMK
jgi:hypothetical protein